MGVFGFAEIMTNLEQKENRVDITDKIGSLYPNFQEFKEAAPAVVRGTALFGPGHPAGRRRRAVLVRLLHAREEDLEEPGALRQGPPGRPGWPRVG